MLERKERKAQLTTKHFLGQVKYIYIYVSWNYLRLCCKENTLNVWNLYTVPACRSWHIIIFFFYKSIYHPTNLLSEYYLQGHIESSTYRWSYKLIEWVLSILFKVLYYYLKILWNRRPIYYSKNLLSDVMYIYNCSANHQSI